MIRIDPAVENEAVRIAERAMRHDPDLSLRVHPQLACPGCGNDIMDLLCWVYVVVTDHIAERVNCRLCRNQYAPRDGQVA